MSVTASVVSTQDLSMPDREIPEDSTPTFDERWSVWQARGAAHDRAVRRRMMFALPILAVVAAVLYALLLR
jgi:hypothetical protein